MTMTESPHLERRKYRLGIEYYGGLLHYFRWWILAIVLALAIAGTVVAQFTDLDTSWWGNLMNGIKIAVGVMAGITIYESMPSFISAGITRKEFAVSNLVCYGLVGTTVAMAGAIGLVIEHLIFSALGWFHPSPTFREGEAMSNIGEVLAASSVYFISFPTVAVAGLAIGSAFYRNGLLGSVVLLPILVTVLAVDGAMYDNSIQIFGFLDIYDASPIVGVIGSFVFAPILAWLSFMWIKDANLHEVKS